MVASTEEPLDQLTPQQEEAIIALLAQPTVAKAAEACGVPERTLYYWLNQPAFSAAYRSARRESFTQAVGMVHRYAPLAINTLAKMLTDPAAPYPSRVSAASALLRFAREGLELDDLALRVAALERVVPEAIGKSA